MREHPKHRPQSRLAEFHFVRFHPLINIYLIIQEFKFSLRIRWQKFDLSHLIWDMSASPSLLKDQNTFHFKLVKNLDQEQALRIFHSCNQVNFLNRISDLKLFSRGTDITFKHWLRASCVLSVLCIQICLLSGAYQCTRLCTERNYHIFWWKPNDILWLVSFVYIFRCISVSHHDGIF